MQILAIERFTDDRYAKNAKAYLRKNDRYILECHKRGIIQAYWSRGDRAGTVLMLEVDSLESVKKVLKSMPLVKKGIVTYNLVPLEPYQAQQMLQEEDELLTIVYVSEETSVTDKEALNKLLEKSRIRNEKLDITGILLYDEGSFFQLLEGKPRPVRALYKKICADKRHRNIAKITEFKTREKSFSDWSMGYVDIRKEDLQSIEGMNDFFQNSNSFHDLKDKQVQKILEAFRLGKWRQKIT